MSNRVNKSDRKIHIMNAALRIFAEKGFQNATISEISKAAGVSDATVYEYFGTKEKLLFSIPEQISDENIQELQKVLPYIKGIESKLRAILLMFMRLYESNPHYSNLVLLQLMSNRDFRHTAAHAAIRKSARMLLDCIKQGIDEGSFRKDSDPYLIRSMLMGTVEHLFIHWHMQGMPEREAPLMDYLDPFLEIVFDGIRAKITGNTVTLHLKVEDGQGVKSITLETPSIINKEENRSTE
jgi:TetR/AcrR family transcriptional regulator, fatty acid metabolism regulator protein